MDQIGVTTETPKVIINPSACVVSLFCMLFNFTRLSQLASFNLLVLAADI